MKNTILKQIKAIALCITMLTLLSKVEADGSSKVTYSDTKDFNLVMHTGKDKRNFTVARKVSLKASYTKGEKEPYILEVPQDGEADKKEENKNIKSFADPLDVNFFIDDASKLIKSALDPNDKDSIQLITRESMMEVYVWMIRSTNGFEDNNISGYLHLNSFVKLYDDINQHKTPVNQTNTKYYNELDNYTAEKVKVKEAIKNELLVPIDAETRGEILNKLDQEILTKRNKVIALAGASKSAKSLELSKDSLFKKTILVPQVIDLINKKNNGESFEINNLATELNFIKDSIKILLN
ncbi:MAG: hypothetical protein IPP32_12625 [Bacteroidetes bacterium]|nr:hypothetical protein [Bacteroidota bacterium]